MFHLRPEVLNDVQVGAVPRPTLELFHLVVFQPFLGRLRGIAPKLEAETKYTGGAKHRACFLTFSKTTPHLQIAVISKRLELQKRAWWHIKELFLKFSKRMWFLYLPSRKVVISRVKGERTLLS